MKFIVWGEFLYFQYEHSVVNALRKNNIDVLIFNIREQALFEIIFKIEYFFSFSGISSFILKRKLVKVVLKNKVNVILFWRPTILNPSDILYIKSKTNVKTISYVNDNPFSPLYSKGSFVQQRLWVNFIKSIRCFDINLVYRPQNISDYINKGSVETYLFPPAYVPDMRYEYAPSSFTYDVIFIGYPDSHRIGHLNYLIENGVDLKVYGSGWNPKDLHPNYKYGRIIPILDQEYFLELKKSKICLAFLSKLNQDVYTRRNFEITGIGSLMLSERTKELTDLFDEGTEAEYFSNKYELLNKIKILLNDENKQKNIRLHARLKVKKAGHTIEERVKKLIELIKN